MINTINSSFPRTWQRVFTLPVLWLLVACSSQQNPVNTGNIHITLQTSKDINPNEQGKANPVRVTLYQLSKDDAFLTSDYFTLQEFAAPELVSQVDKVNSTIMSPGEKKELALNVKDGMSAIGVVTAYRDISRAQWRAIYSIPDRPRDPWYARLWPTKKKWQPKAIVNMKYLTTSIEQVE